MYILHTSAYIKQIRFNCHVNMSAFFFSSFTDRQSRFKVVQFTEIVIEKFHTAIYAGLWLGLVLGLCFPNRLTMDGKSSAVIAQDSVIACSTLVVSKSFHILIILTTHWH